MKFEDINEAQIQSLQHQVELLREIIKSHHGRMRHQSDMLNRVVRAGFDLLRFAEEEGLGGEPMVDRMRRELDYQGFCFTCKSLQCDCGECDD